MTIKVFEAFSGVGSQRMALRNLGIDHEVVAIAEIDKFAIKSYEAIHGETNNLGDISQLGIDDIPDHDLFTYSFPCQDISVAGKGLGLDEGSDTRSGLLWECQKVIAGKKPKYLLLENVKNLVGKKHRHNFDKWLVWLEEQGYTNYWQVLNAKDYGIPQNRERVFVVSILGGHEPYQFPEPIELESRLKDVLEDEVDEKFYLSEEKTQQMVTTISEKHSEKTVVKMNRHEVKGESQVANTLLARDYKGFGNQDMNGVIEPNVLTPKRTEYGKAIRKDYESGLIKESRLNMTEMRPRTDGVSNTLTTVLKDNYVAEPKAKRIGGIFDKEGTKHQAGAVWDKDQISPALDTMQGGWRQPSVVDGEDSDNYSIRRLTPKECWRLMGFSDVDFHKAEEVNSNTQLYKQAGNSIVVNVLEGIFKQLLEVQ